MKVSYAVVTDVGQVRSTNQDNYNLNGSTKPVQDLRGSGSGVCADPYMSFVVCDGMGGEQFGEVAASLAVETLKKYTQEQFWHQWQQCINQANQAICDFAHAKGAYTGTTLAGLLFHGGAVASVNVGDSRTYRIHHNQIEQMSLDHTEFQMLVDCGKLQKSDFSKTKTHNRLTQHLGIDPEEMVLEPFVAYEENVEAGELFLLCSDGLYGVVPEEVLLAQMLSGESPEVISRKLIQLALQYGSRDNITAMVVRVDETDADATGGGNTGSGNAGDGFESTMNIPKELPKGTLPTAGNQAGGRAASQAGGKVQPKKSSPLKLLLPLLLVLLLGGGGAGYYLYANPTVPNVIGMDASTAETTLKSKGFKLKTEFTYDDTVDNEVVIAQAGTEGARRKRGATVRLTVSQGKAPVELANYVGQSLEAAKASIEAAGLKYDVEEVYSETGSVGTVISQTPKAGAKTTAGSTVKLTVSLGTDTEELETETDEFETEAEALETESEE